MKKLLISISAALLSLVLVFGATACGTTPEQKLKEYIDSDEFQSRVNNLKEENSLLNIDIRSEGTDLIYEYTYIDLLDEKGVLTAKNSIDTQEAVSAEAYEKTANELVKYGVTSPTVIVKYNNADGTNIATYKYTATD